MLQDLITRRSTFLIDVRSISFKTVDVNFDATLYTTFKSPYLIKFNLLRNMNVFNRFHYNPSCGSLDFPVKVLNILHNSIYHLLWNVEDCIVNFFCTVCFYQLIRVGLRNCTRIKGVHGVEGLIWGQREWKKSKVHSAAHSNHTKEHKDGEKRTSLKVYFLLSQKLWLDFHGRGRLRLERGNKPPNVGCAGPGTLTLTPLSQWLLMQLHTDGCFSCIHLQEAITCSKGSSNVLPVAVSKYFLQNSLHLLL